MRADTGADADERYRGAYDVSDAVPVESVTSFPAGTNVLISGPTGTERDDVALSLLGQCEANEHAVLVAASRGADRLIERDEHLTAAHEAGRVHAVDCTGTGDGRRDTDRVKYVSSPGDLTGVGIGIVKCTREIDDVPAAVRLGVVSLSTLVQYASLSRTFNFAHVLSGRTAASGHLGVWTLDPSVHDDQTANTLRAEFDVRVELREADSGATECRAVGVDGVPKTWRPL